MDRMPLLVRDRPKVVHWLAYHVHHAAEGATTDRSGNWPTLINGLHSANHAISRFHGDGAHSSFAQVLLYFQNDIDFLRHLEAIADHAKSLIDGRHNRRGELHVHGGTRDFNYVSNVFWHIFPVETLLLTSDCVPGQN